MSLDLTLQGKSKNFNNTVIFWVWFEGFIGKGFVIGLSVEARVYNRVKAGLGQCLSQGTLVDLKVGIRWTV